MSVVEINRDPSLRQLRQFGFLWLAFLTFFGLVCGLRFSNWQLAIVLWVLALVVPIIGWRQPTFMRTVFVGLSYLAWPVGFVVSHIVLAAVYYLVLTPVGLVMRLVGHDPMARRFDASATSYWVKRDSRDLASSSYFRQF